tara:strand:+ start:1658 stop:3106 length:1449 start_codon:yes stop_codon:yes gene_type:complete
MLNNIDRELLLTNKDLDYTSKDNQYLGGFFGSDSTDYVELYIYDVNDNLLETAIVDPEDYYLTTEKGGVKLNTGTILRKLGYDRGKFKVTYNFFRKLGGSYETVLVNDEGQVYDGDFHIVGNKIFSGPVSNPGEELFVKEYKYLTHEISPSRTEVRIIPQNIRDEKYVRDFFKLAARTRKVRSDGSGDSFIQFVGQNPLSKKIEFVNNTSVFEDQMVGGSIRIPNVFVSDIIVPPTPLTGDDIGTKSFEVINEQDIFQASFFLEDILSGTEKQNNLGVFGDKKFAIIYQAFKSITDADNISEIQVGSETILPDNGVNFVGNGRTLNDIRNLSDRKFNPIYLDWGNSDSGGAVIDFASNSFLRADVAVTYTWDITGYDQDGDNFNRLQPKFDFQRNDIGGNIEIVDVDDESYASVSSSNPLRGSVTITPSSEQQDEDRTERQGGKIRIKLWGKGLHFGIRLTIDENIGNDSSTLHLPAIVETH